MGLAGCERSGGRIGLGSCMEAAIGVDKARKERSSRAVTLPVEVHLGCGFRCSGMVKEKCEDSQGKWKERSEVVDVV